MKVIELAQVVGDALKLPRAVFTAGAVFAVAYLVSATAQPIVRRAAHRLGFLDHPNEERRFHAHAVPRLGGVGVFVALLVTCLAAAAFDSAGHVVSLLPLVIAMAVGAGMLFMIGLADDITGVPPIGKLAVQSAAALVVYQYGFRIEHVVLPPGVVVDLGGFALPITVLWIVGLSNAFNLIDGADGLAGGVAIIALVATTISAAYVGDMTVVFCSLALIGALLGFLRFNWPPARIFLGDSGSLVVGFLLAVLTVKGMSRQNGDVFGLAPIFALSYPLMDTGISMLRRWLRGEPLSRADGRHIHHQLQKLGVGPRQSLVVLYSLSGLVAILGLAVTFAPPQLTIAIAVAGAAMLVLVLIYGARWLQYHELLEAGSSIQSALFTARTRVQDKIAARDVARLVERARNPEELAQLVENSAALFRYTHMQLRWGYSRGGPPRNKVSDAEAARLWALDYPIKTFRKRSEPLFLSVWCNVEGVRAASVERVAEILSSSVERWLVRHSEQVVTSKSFMPERQRMKFGRESGAIEVSRWQPSGATLQLESASDIH